MAKLTDVNVLDMQDGKVTRVVVNGVEFSATGGESKQVGDVVYANESKLDVTKGAYYVVTESAEHNYRIQDDVGDRHGIDHRDARFITFRKQSAPDLAQRVDAIDARVSALEGAKQAPPRAFKVGDYAKVATGRARMYDLSGGEIVKLAFNDGCYDFRAHSVSRIVDELCDAADLEPASDAEVAHAKRAAKFTALGRAEGELREGDLVRVTRTKGSGDGIRVGQLLETTVDGDENSVGVLSGWRVAAELVAPAEARVDAN